MTYYVEDETADDTLSRTQIEDTLDFHGFRTRIHEGMVQAWTEAFIITAEGSINADGWETVPTGYSALKEWLGH